jgi:hypothetical protein
MSWLKSRIELLRNDKDLLKIFLLHLLLIALHIYENYVGDVEYYWYLRAGGCGLISLFIFMFGRKGLSYALVVFSCSLVYVNNFYNYATIFFMLIAIGANPKIKKVAPWIYFVNMVISYTLKRLGIVPFLIHSVYCVMFYTKINYVFAIHKPEKLSLTDDERKILDLKLQGFQQKEIDIFSQQTISAKMKSARERNLCETTEELMAKYAKEKENG